MEKKQTKKMRVPEDKKGLIIGREFSGLKHIADITKAKVFRHPNDNEIYVKGTVVQIEQAEKLIHDKLAGIFKHKKKNATETTFKVPQVFMGRIIGRNGSNIQRLETKMGTKIDQRDFDDQFKQITIVGDPETCIQTRRCIQRIILRCRDSTAREELGGGRNFACFNQDYLDTEFQLVKCSDLLKLKYHIYGNLYEIKIQNPTVESNEMVQGKDVTLSILENALLPILTNLSNQKEEKKLLVDLWCHFGKAFFHNVKTEDLEDGGIFTMEKINERLGNNEQNFQKDLDTRKDYWKTTFPDGVCSDHEKILKENIETFLRFKCTTWRYDYVFVTPLGRNIRFKSWENLSTDEPPLEVKNLLTRLEVKGQENALLSWLCHPSNTLVTCDLLVPNSEYDCRLKLRTGPKFVGSKSEEDEEEDKILSDYLSHCTLDNHQLSLPTEESLPEGFQCLFYQAAQNDMYLYDAEDEEEENFIILFLHEDGWDTDTSEKIKLNQLSIRVVMDSWSDALLSGNWEPQKIVDLLPKFMEFVETFQKNLFR